MYLFNCKCNKLDRHAIHTEPRSGFESHRAFYERRTDHDQHPPRLPGTVNFDEVIRESRHSSCVSSSSCAAQLIYVIGGKTTGPAAIAYQETPSFNCSGCTGNSRLTEAQRYVNHPRRGAHIRP